MPYRAGEYNSSLTLPPNLYALYACRRTHAPTSCKLGKKQQHGVRCEERRVDAVQQVSVAISMS